MTGFTYFIDDIKLRIKYLDEQIDLQKKINKATSSIFLTQKDVANILKMSPGQVKRLFLRNDFPACTYFKSYVVEYNFFIDFLASHFDENEKFKEALLHNILEENING